MHTTSYDVSIRLTRSCHAASVGVIDPDAASPRSWHPYIFITEDAGQSWRKAWGRHHGLHSWISHPSRRAWALVSWWNGACNKVEKAEEEKGQDDPDKEKAWCKVESTSWRGS